MNPAQRAAAASAKTQASNQIATVISTSGLPYHVRVALQGANHSPVTITDAVASARAILKYATTELGASGEQVAAEYVKAKTSTAKAMAEIAAAKTGKAAPAPKPKIDTSVGIRRRGHY